MATRLTLIIATVSTLGLIALGVTSVDAAVRRMGARGWQRLHNAVYVLAGLVLLHFLPSPGIFPEQYLMSGLFFWLMAWRVLDRYGRGTDEKALVVLAVASALFAALLEAGWQWARRGYEPAGTLANNFTLDLGVPPAWQIWGSAFWSRSSLPRSDTRRVSGRAAWKRAKPGDAERSTLCPRGEQ